MSKILLYVWAFMGMLTIVLVAMFITYNLPTPKQQDRPILEHITSIHAAPAHRDDEGYSWRVEIWKDNKAVQMNEGLGDLWEHLRDDWRIYDETTTIRYDFGNGDVRRVHLSELFEYMRNEYWCAESNGESVRVCD